jgi:hypothetical protein
MLKRICKKYVIYRKMINVNYKYIVKFVKYMRVNNPLVIYDIRKDRGVYQEFPLQNHSGRD